MSHYTTARWTRSLSAPPCPGAWSYRTLGKFPVVNTAATDSPHEEEEEEQQQQHQQQHEQQHEQQQQQQQHQRQHRQQGGRSSIHHVLHRGQHEQQQQQRQQQQQPLQHATSVPQLAGPAAASSTTSTSTSTSAHAAQRRVVNIHVFPDPPSLTRAQGMLRTDHDVLMRLDSTNDQHMHIRLPPPANTASQPVPVASSPYPTVDRTGLFKAPDSSTSTHHHYYHHCDYNPADLRNPPSHQPCCFHLHTTPAAEKHSPVPHTSTAIRHHSYNNPQLQPQPVHPEFSPQPPPSRVHLSLQTSSSATTRTSNDTGTRKRTRTSTEGTQRPSFVHSHSFPSRYPLSHDHTYVHSHHVHSSGTIPENIPNHPPCYSRQNPHDPRHDHPNLSHTHTHSGGLSRLCITPLDMRSLQTQGELGPSQRPYTVDGNCCSLRGRSIRPSRPSLSGSSITSPISPTSTTSVTRSVRIRQSELDGSDAQSPRASIRGETFTSSNSPSTSLYPASQYHDDSLGESAHDDSDSNLDDIGERTRDQRRRGTSPAPKRSRKSYTREFKLEALDLLKRPRKNDKGETVSASDTWVSKQIGVTRKVLRGWKVQEDKLRASRTGSRRVRVGKNKTRRGKVVEAGGTHGEQDASMSNGVDEFDEEEQEDLLMDQSRRRDLSKCRGKSTRKERNGSEAEVDEDTDIEEDELEDDEDLEEDEEEDEGGYFIASRTERSGESGVMSRRA